MKKHRNARPRLESLLEGVDGLSELELAALRAAVPKRGIPPSSRWVLDGTRRAAEATGLTPFRVLDLLTPVLERCYRERRLRWEDAALTLAQVELTRRTFGAQPATITMPEIDAPGSPTPDDARSLIAGWEAQSITAAVTRPGDDPSRQLMSFGACVTLVGHLSVADGVPVRFDELDPAALAAELASGPEMIGTISRPKGYERTMLAAVADVCERLADEGHVRRQLADDLRRLALGVVERDARLAS